LERTLRKRLHASVDTVKTLRTAGDKTLAARERASKERRAKQEARLARGGLAGQKLGKHVVREGEVDVQLGEELTESLRGLQVRWPFWRAVLSSVSSCEEVVDPPFLFVACLCEPRRIARR
jgi:nucleolar protein 53